MRKTLRRLLLAAALLIIILPLGGCWDRKEIENRGYVLGVAIDHAPAGEGTGKKEFLAAPQGAGRRKYRVTMELPKFRKEASKEISSSQQHLLWSAEGESMLAVARAINARVYFGMFFEDIQIMIFSEAVAREGIGGILDFWLRDAEIRRKVKLLVAPGHAEDVLKANFQVDEVNSVFIAKLPKNADRSPYFPSKATVGEISEAIRAKRSFVLPFVLVEGKEVKLAKAAVFDKRQRMIGELDEFEVYGGKLIRRELKQGVVVVANPAAPGKIAAFELYEADTKVTPHLEDGKLRFSLEAKFIGTIGENQVTGQDALDPEFTTAMEQAVATEYTQIARKSYDRQQALKVEIFGLGKLVYNRYPQYWKSVKDRWEEEVFPSTPIDIKIAVSVRRPVLKR
ncbi:Ger(x)C family spore germination protein [Anaeroselena agilis]|uniref:Ger(X)C family spore germination protein n=1 Tax=Anaeroselena agilis TaxID=3063788 RepID=A0ABU3NXP9_9FIRM|nr:Ger(x)C family spore germination protein [Selenomonadales bacterium 4137-cl]